MDELNLSQENLQNGQIPKLKHSGLGISSFVISILNGMFFIILLIAAAFVGMSESSVDSYETSPILVIIGLLIFLGMFTSLVGTGLGIAGVLQKSRKKVFSILGLIFNLLTIFGVLSLIVIGNTMV